MAIRPIRILGQPGDEVLRRPTTAVDVIDGSLQTLIDDMLETVIDAPGVGLAAPQVGVPLRVIVISVAEVPPFALINGEVVRHSGKRWLEEGCLSIPGYRGELYRSVRVTVQGRDRQGRRIRIRAVDDVLAQALEHEIDHTNGLLYISLLSASEHLHRTPVAAVAKCESEQRPAVKPANSRRRGRPPLLTRGRGRRIVGNELGDITAARDAEAVPWIDVRERG